MNVDTVFYNKKSVLYNLSGTFVITVNKKLFMINSFIMTVSFERTVASHKI